MKRLDLLLIHLGAAHGIYGELGDDLVAVEPPLWCRLIAGYCLDREFTVKIIDAEAERLSPRDVAEATARLDPQLACLCVYGHQPSASTQQMHGAGLTARAIKEARPEIPVMMLGGHVSALPERTLREEAIDFVCSGEGPITVAKLLFGMRNGTYMRMMVPGLWWMEGGEVQNTPAAPLIEDLGQLHGDAWHLLPMDRYRAHNWQCFGDLGARQPYASIYTSLGCPYRCSFCLREGTVIVTAKGKNRKIEDLRIGDKLLAWDEQKKEIAETVISQTAFREVDELIRIVATSGESIEVTAEHPLYTQRGWVDAGKVRTTDRLWVMETRDKMRFQMRTNNPAKNMTPEWREKITQSQRGQKRSPELKERYRLSKLGDKNPMKRKEVSMAPALRASRSKRMKELWADPQRAAEFNATRPTGADHSRWAGGLSKYPWPLKFNDPLKRRIRQRDNETCQECGVTKGLTVHHVNYDKDDCEDCNLLTLCRRCNSRANANRPFWQKKYSEMLSTRGHCPSFQAIERIETIKGKFRVYNFECSPYDNYWADRILVHNCCINAPFKTNRYRTRHPGAVVEEIVRLRNDYGVRTFKIVDEMFVLKERHYAAIAEGLVAAGAAAGWNAAEELNIWAYARVDTIEPAKLALLRSAGFRWLAIGVESGSAHVRDGAKKAMREADIMGVVSEVEAAGINVIANYIFGLPDDDMATMRETLDLALELNTEFANFYSAMAYPGSPLYDQAVREGWTLPASWRGYSQHNDDCRPLDTKHVSAAEVLRFRDEAFTAYFTSPNYLRMVEAKFGAETLAHVLGMTGYKLRRKLLEMEMA